MIICVIMSGTWLSLVLTGTVPSHPARQSSSSFSWTSWPYSAPSRMYSIVQGVSKIAQSFVQILSGHVPAGVCRRPANVWGVLGLSSQDCVWHIHQHHTGWGEQRRHFLNYKHFPSVCPSFPHHHHLLCPDRQEDKTETDINCQQIQVTF